MNQNQLLDAPEGKAYGGRTRVAPPHSATAGSLRSQRDIFVPGFTVLSNHLLEERNLQLNLSQRRVLDCVQRATTGFCREWAKQRHVLGWLKKMDLSSYYRGRKALVAQGLIELRSDQDNTLWIRLCPAVQPIKREHLDTLHSPFNRTPRQCCETDLQQHQADLRCPQKQTPAEQPANPIPTTVCELLSESPKEEEKREENEEQQQPEMLEAKDEPLAQIPVVVEPVAIAEQPSLPPKPLACEAETAPAKQSKGRSLAEEQLKQAAVLLAAGVAHPKNEQLARLKPSAAIARALADLARSPQVLKPGGWLVQGLDSGRYDHEPPMIQPSQASREPKQERKIELTPADREAMLQEVRRRDAEQATADRSRLDRQTTDEIARVLGALSASEYAQLEGRARAQLGRVAAMLPAAALQGTMMGLLGRGA